MSEHKQDRLYKLSKGSHVARWAHDEIVNQDNLLNECLSMLESFAVFTGSLGARALVEKIKTVRSVK